MNVIVRAIALAKTDSIFSFVGDDRTEGGHYGLVERLGPSKVSYRDRRVIDELHSEAYWRGLLGRGLTVIHETAVQDECDSPNESMVTNPLIHFASRHLSIRTCNDITDRPIGSWGLLVLQFAAAFECNS